MNSNVSIKSSKIPCFYLQKGASEGVMSPSYQTFQSMMSQYASEDSMLDDCAKEVSKLVNLFEVMADSENNCHFDNSELYTKAFKIIEKFESQGNISEDELNRIISLVSRIYPNIKNKNLQSLIFNFNFNHLNFSNVYTHLQHAKNENNHDHIRKCLECIEKQSGVKFNLDHLSICIKIETPKISFDQLSSQVTILSDIFKDHISITLAPKVYVKLTDIESFLIKHGELVHSLYLSTLEDEIEKKFIDLTIPAEELISDKFIYEFIKLSPNLNDLSISSKAIQGDGFRELKSLKFLKKLDLQSSSLKYLLNLPEGLETLVLWACRDLEELPRLPEGLTTLYLKKCDALKELLSFPLRLSILSIIAPIGLMKLPKLPVGLTSLELRDFNNLVDLSDLPETLNTLIFERCSGLKELSNLPESLQVLDLNACNGLKKLPNLPLDLTTLNIFGSDGLEELPKFPAKLNTLYLNSCAGLSDSYRILFLSSIFAENFEQGMNLFLGFSIEKENKGILLKSIIEKCTGEAIPEGSDIKVMFVSFLEKKFHDLTIPLSTRLRLGQFIVDNQIGLDLFDEHPFIQEAIEILALWNIEEVKNPFKLFKKLNDLSQKSSSFTPPRIETEGISVAINMNQLALLSRGSKIRRQDLPKNVTKEAFDQLTNALKHKVENNRIKAACAFQELGTTWEAIAVPIFDDPKKHLVNMLEFRKEDVSEVEAKWKAVLSNILEKSPEAKKNSFFSEQEEVLILTMMGIQNCEGGKDMGIALSYEQLEPRYRYQIAFSKVAMTIEQSEDKNKEDNAKGFVRGYIEEQKKLEQALTIDSMANNLINVVNENLKENSKIIYPLIDDQNFWKMDEDSGDMLLNNNGALKLLTIVIDEEEAEKNQFLIDQFIGQAIKKLMSAQFDGTNSFMQELTGDAQVREGAHQAIYVKNLIGQLVGVSHQVVFDLRTVTLYNKLLEKTREEVLKIFFKFVTPESLINEVVRTVNEKPAENKQLLKPLIDDKFWNNENPLSLSRRGAFVLLEKLGYLEKK